MSIQQALIDISEADCGEPEQQWIDFVAISPKDAWQIAFSAGLMAATERLRRELGSTKRRYDANDPETWQ